jgi:membrane dipeptidase
LLAAQIKEQYRIYFIQVLDLLIGKIRLFIARHLKMIFDAHSDFGLFVFKKHLRKITGIMSQDHYAKLLAANVCVEVLTVGGDFSFWGIDFSKKETVLQTISAVKKEIEMSEGKFFLIESQSDFNNLKVGSIGIILSLEGASPLLGSENSLNEFYLNGIRSILLTTNSENPFSGGCLTPHIGLTNSGKALLNQIYDMPIILDLSHISERSFFEISESYEKPFIVSHANIKSICDHYRNLTDEQLIRLAEHDGVIGISLVSLFIENHDTRRTDIAMLMKHFQYASERTGTQHVGIGPDFMDYMQDTLTDYIIDHKLPLTMFTYPQGIESVEDLQKIKYLFDDNYNETDKNAILFGNFERVYKSILTG